MSRDFLRKKNIHTPAGLAARQEQAEEQRKKEFFQHDRWPPNRIGSFWMERNGRWASPKSVFSAYNEGLYLSREAVPSRLSLCWKRGVDTEKKIYPKKAKLGWKLINHWKMQENCKKTWGNYLTREEKSDILTTLPLYWFLPSAGGRNFLLTEG